MSWVFVGFVMTILTLTWALCAVAGRADDRADAMWEKRERERRDD